jgi:hypothetical protein
VTVLLVLCQTQGRTDRAVTLANAVQQLGDFLALSHDCYLVNTARSSDEVFRELRVALGLEEDAESLVVLRVPRPYLGQAPARVWLWFQSAEQSAAKQ